MHTTQSLALCAVTVWLTWGRAIYAFCSFYITVVKYVSFQLLLDKQIIVRSERWKFCGITIMFLFSIFLQYKYNLFMASIVLKYVISALI